MIVSIEFIAAFAGIFPALNIRWGTTEPAKSGVSIHIHGTFLTYYFGISHDSSLLIAASTAALMSIMLAHGAWSRVIPGLLGLL